MATVTDRIQDNEIWELWQKLQTAYYKYGCGLNLPKNTDPTKTYQWRYVVQLCRKLHDWDFDDALTTRYINELVQYAINRGLLNKGLSVVCQANILDKIYKNMKYSTQNIDVLLNLLNSNHEMLLDDSNGNVLEYLTNVTNKRHMITNLYETGKLSEQYMCLSRNCTSALSKARVGNEIYLVPSAKKMLNLRISLSDLDNEFKQILGTDLRGFGCKL